MENIGIEIQAWAAIRGGKFSFILNRIGWILRGVR